MDMFQMVITSRIPVNKNKIKETEIQKKCDPEVKSQSIPGHPVFHGVGA